MSLLLSSTLSSLLTASNPNFSSQIMRDDPQQSVLTLTNSGAAPITGFGNNFSALHTVEIVPALSTCNNISLFNPLNSGQSCTYTFKVLAKNSPGAGTETITITADSSSSTLYSMNFLAATATYLYVGTSANVQKWDGSAWSTVGTAPPSKVQALAFDDEGNLFAGTNADLEVWNGTNWNQVGSKPPINVNALGFDDQGNLFAGTSTYGAQELAKGSSTWQAVGSNGPVDVTSLKLVSSNHTLYVGTNDYTEQWDGHSWSRTPGSALLGSVAFALDSKNNLLYTGTDSGKVYQMNLNNNAGWVDIGKAGDKYDLVDSLTFNNTQQLFAGLDNTDDSIKAYQSESSWTNYGSNIPAFITALIFDGDNNLYAANYGSGPNVFELSGGANASWQAIPGAPQNLFANALAIGSELNMSIIPASQP